jgi:hypothetical protein
MSAAIVGERQILEALHKVPQEQWADVLVLIEEMAAAPDQGGDKKRVMTASDLLGSALVGMWADRTDIADSRQFARRLREEAQTRRPDK